jgi:hypothetical protein
MESLPGTDKLTLDFFLALPEQIQIDINFDIEKERKAGKTKEELLDRLKKLIQKGEELVLMPAIPDTPHVPVSNEDLKLALEIEKNKKSGEGDMDVDIPEEKKSS